MSISSTDTVQMDTYGYLAPNRILDTVAEDGGYLLPNLATRTFENSDCDSSEAIASLYRGIKDEEGREKMDEISKKEEEVSSTHTVNEYGINDNDEDGDNDEIDDNDIDNECCPQTLNFIHYHSLSGN